MPRLQVPTWVLATVGAVGLIAASVLAFFIYVNVSPARLHQGAAAVPVGAGDTPDPRWRQAALDARRIAQAAVDAQNLPGLSVAVGVGRDVVWAEGYGWADLDTRVAVDPSMAFRIGHVSKALTSAAVGLLREEGRLHLDAEVQEYVPSFPRKAWPVSLRQLMGHVAGVRHYRDTEWGDKPSAHCRRADEGLGAFAIDPLLFEPETEYRYSTYGWVLVSAAIEAVAGQPFADVMRARVFAPLGLTSTASEADADRPSNRVTSYFRGNLGREVTTNVDYSCFAGGGAFVSTPTDLVRFGLAITGGAWLKPETVRLLTEPQMLRSGTKTNYGLGWMLDTVPVNGQATRLVSHASRTIEGASTSLLTFPELGLVVAVSSNQSFADTRTVALAIADAFAKANSTAR